jgi:hypothetical protein
MKGDRVVKLSYAALWFRILLSATITPASGSMTNGGRLVPLSTTRYISAVR